MGKNIISVKYPSGHTTKYQRLDNGTCYHSKTDEQVVNVLEKARIARTRIRIFFGDTETGRDWLEEFETVGYIGRSCGEIKVPLLLLSSRSDGGCAVLDHCIVKIMVGREIVYRHPHYHLGNLTIGSCPEVIGKTVMAKAGYTTGVYHDGKNIANFKTGAKAQKYVAFLRGERSRL